MGDSQASPSMVVSGDLGSHSWVTGPGGGHTHAPHTPYPAKHSRLPRAPGQVLLASAPGSLAWAYVAPVASQVIWPQLWLRMEIFRGLPGWHHGSMIRQWPKPYMGVLMLAVAGFMAASQAQGAGDKVLVGASTSGANGLMYQVPYYAEKDRSLIPA